MKCCKKVNHIPKPSNLCQNHFQIPKSCGFRNPDGLGGKVDSKLVEQAVSYAQYAEFPWMMAILVDEKRGKDIMPVYKAGGSLINPKVVMTAAHTIANFGSDKLTVRGGEWDTQSQSEMCNEEERKVSRVITHEKFIRKNLQNDIALLILNEEFELTPFINTICLPPKGTIFNHKRCLSSGWGKSKFGRHGLYQVFMKKIELPVVPHNDCQNKLRRTRLGEDFQLHDKFLCAGKRKSLDFR
jgi:plasma kallikrein